VVKGKESSIFISMHIHIKAPLIFFNLIICWIASSSVARADEANEQRLLAETLPKDNVVWLELGTGSSDASKSLAIYRRTTQTNSKGSVIVLKNSVSNTSIHAALLESLAEGLVKEGWHTLLVYMPPAANADGQKRLEAAITFVKKGDAKNVAVVMADKTAPVLASSGKSEDQPFQKLILLDAVNVGGEFKQPFMEVLNTQVAVLDMLLGEKASDAPEYVAREQRNAVAKQRKFSHYESINSPRSSALTATESNWAFKRIDGWLKKP